MSVEYHIIRKALIMGLFLSGVMFLMFGIVLLEANRDNNVVVSTVVVIISCVCFLIAFIIKICWKTNDEVDNEYLI